MDSILVASNASVRYALLHVRIHGTATLDSSNHDYVRVHVLTVVRCKARAMGG